MKTINKVTLAICSLAIGIAAPSAARGGVGVTIQVPAPAPPPVVVTPAPAPPTIAVSPAVPDEYVWDGYEYVGIVGDQYYYLGPGNLWIAMDPGRMARFRTWEGGHADWRTHMIINRMYRRDAHGHEYHWHDHDFDHHDHDGH